MSRKMQGLFVGVALALFAVPAGAGLDMQEGSWEITTATEMSGMPMQMPPQKHTQCLKKDDLVPKNSQGPQSCVIKDQSVKGNTVNWIMECSADGVKTVATGSITYSGDSFTGRMDVVMDGMDMKIINTMTGRRLGPCQ